ncbi:MAG: CHAT domain-containing protein [Ardenticatenia bacterium]|nr:CHAT domain-containing protein [Ardenticatenia bacterium]
MADLDAAIQASKRPSPSPARAPDWATMQANLGLALRTRFEALGQVADLDAAIQAFQKALALAREGSPDWATMQANLGGAFLRRFEALGQVADLDAAIQAFQKALAVAREGSPDWATMQANLGLALRTRFEALGQVADLDAAIQAFQKALAGLDPEAFPDYALRAALPLGRLLVRRRQAGDLARAAAAYDRVRPAAQYLYFEALHPARRTRELQRTQEMPIYHAYALAAGDRLQEAVEALEAGRARQLAETLLSAQVQQRLGDPTLKAAWRRVQEALSQYHRADGSHRAQAEAQVAQARRAYYARLRDVFPEFFESPRFEQVALAAHDIPLIYLLTTPAGGLALVVHGGEVTPVFLDDLKEDIFRERLVGPADDPRLGGYFGAYGRWRDNHRDREATTAWLAALEATTRWMWDVAMGPVVERLRERGLDRAVLIPTGLLALLPWHAAWTDEGGERRYALDEITFTYAPSAQALAAARGAAQHTPAARTLLAVVAPAHSGERLPNARNVLAAMRGLFGDYPTTFPAYGPAATLTTVMRALPHYDAHLFFCHGINAWGEPLESRLALVCGKPLTVRHLLNEAPRLRSRLTFLASCETGAIGTRLPDEVVGLVAGFLQAGTAAVVAPLWTVYEASTAELTNYFFRAWKEEGLPPAQALHQAQRHMRHSDRWSHPVFWAAFALSGDGWTVPERATTAKEVIMVTEERNGRRQEEEAARELEPTLADLPGDPDAAPVLYRCAEHGDIPPEDVNWYPDLKAKCPHCGQPLDEADGGEA